MLESVGHYKILDTIGSGAMGDLFRARDTRLGRTVALRIVAPGIAGEPSRLDAFLADARASASVSHPNVAALYEVGEDGGVHFLASEFVQGQTLKGLIAGRPLNPRRAIDLTIQIADALADAYANDVAHGDLRAETVIVNAKGNAKLLDFGLARWTAQAKAAATAPSASGAGGHEEDIAALGALLHEMLTGRPPSPNRAPSELDQHLPRELDSILQRTQIRSGGDRYEASATLAAELRSVAAILDVRAKAASEVTVAPAAATRRRGAIVWLALLATAGALAWLLWTVSRLR
jgi:serine/threonine-protein kinase